jgi:hypothetical protein
MGLKDWALVTSGVIISILIIWLSIEIQPRETKTTSVSIDSSQTVTIDTTFAPDTSRTLKPNSIPEPDTVFVDSSTADESEENSEYTKLRSYTTTVSDSLIDAKINTVVRGYLVDQNLMYTPQYPLKIRVNTETVVTKTVTETIQPKSYPSVGIMGSTDFKTLRGFTITGSWTMANGNKIMYGYNPIIKTHTIGISYNIKNFFR